MDMKIHPDYPAWAVNAIQHLEGFSYTSIDMARSAKVVCEWLRELYDRNVELESALANREEHIARMEKENAVLNRAVDIVISEVERYRLAYESGGYSVMSDIEWRESYRGNVLAQSKGLCNAD
jgi:hypothetical protein